MQDVINTLEERVIVLHDIARQVEQEVGKGALSDDLRSAADRLNDVLTLRIDEESDQVIFDRTLKNTADNVLMVLKS